MWVRSGYETRAFPYYATILQVVSFLVGQYIWPTVDFRPMTSPVNSVTSVSLGNSFKIFVPSSYRSKSIQPFRSTRISSQDEFYGFLDVLTLKNFSSTKRHCIMHFLASNCVFWPITCFLQSMTEYLINVGSMKNYINSTGTPYFRHLWAPSVRQEQ